MILWTQGRVLLIENKSEDGTLSDEQKQIHMQAMYLGHKIHEVRSYRQFLKIVEG